MAHSVKFVKISMKLFNIMSGNYENFEENSKEIFRIM